MYFGESKRSLKSRSNEHVRSVKNTGIEKNEITKQSWKEGHNFDWNRREVIVKEIRFSRKIQESIHSLRSPN